MPYRLRFSMLTPLIHYLGSTSTLQSKLIQSSSLSLFFFCLPYVVLLSISATMAPAEASPPRMTRDEIQALGTISPEMKEVGGGLTPPTH